MPYQYSKARGSCSTRQGFISLFPNLPISARVRDVVVDEGFPQPNWLCFIIRKAKPYMRVESSLARSSSARILTDG